MRKDEDVKGNSLRKYGEGDEAFGRRAGQKADHGYGNHEGCGRIRAEGSASWRSGGSDRKRV